jgi:hypothetical protein
MSKLRDFKAPESESAVYKNIPMTKYTAENRKVIREVLGKTVRFVFRGPRRFDYNRFPQTRQASCIKANAVTFSVYIRRSS